MITAVNVPTLVESRCNGQVFHMNGETVLLRVVDGSWEGWKWMELSEFLRQVSIETWNERHLLVGMVLPPARRETVH